MECLVGLRLVCLARLRCKSLEVGCEWFDRVRTLSADDLLRAVSFFRRVDPGGMIWLQLIGLAAEGPATVPELLLSLEGMPPQELWCQILGLHSRPDAAPDLEAALVRAGAGDPGALEQQLPGLDRLARRWVPEVVKSLGGNADEAKFWVVRTLRLWYAHVFGEQWPELEPVLDRDAAAKRQLARQLSWSDLLDRATNGVEYVLEVGVDRLRLIPTYLARPMTMTVRQRRTMVVCYPGADVPSIASPEARVGQVMKYARVLADETRARALWKLSASSLTLQELADELQVSKSTMHHHLDVLRSVGLVRVRPDGRRYSLRREAVAELSGLLRSTFG